MAKKTGPVSIRYVTPKDTQHVTCSVNPMLTVGAFDTPEYGRVFDVKAISDYLGLEWHGQRNRIAGSTWGIRLLTRGPIDRQPRMYLPGGTLQLWLGSLTSSQNRVNEETQARIEGLFDKIVGGIRNQSGELQPTRSPQPRPGAVTAPGGPVDFSGAQIALLQAMTTTLVGLQAALTGTTVKQDYMGEALADIQAQTVELRDGNRAGMESLMATVAAHEMTLGGLKMFVTRMGNIVEGAIRINRPGMDPNYSFDQGCRLSGVELDERTKRALSVEFAQQCIDRGIPIRINPAKGWRHVFHTYDLGEIKRFLTQKGLMPEALTAENWTNVPSDV